MGNVKLIEHPEELIPYMSMLMRSKTLAVSIETTGVDPRLDKVRFLLLAAEGAAYTLAVDCFSFMPKGLGLVREIFSAGTIKIFYDAKLQLQFLAAWDIFPHVLFDALLAAQLLHAVEGSYNAGLETLVARYLPSEPGLSQTSGKTIDWGGKIDDSQLGEAARKTAVLPRLREAMIPHILRNGLVKVAGIEFQCVRAVAHMEYGGIQLDEQKWRALLEATTQTRNSALQALQPFLKDPVCIQNTLWGDEEVIGPNFDSSVFVLNLLRRNGIVVESTSRQALYPYRSYPLVAALSAYRKATKSVSSFLRPYLSMIHPVSGRLHPRYGQLAVFSGRMSCSAPNIQQIPREPAFRSCFNAPRGRSLILADYSQIELRVAAQISEDRRMLAAYQAGEDLHLLTASYLSGKPVHLVDKQERQAYKAVNLGLIYGMGAVGLQQTSQLTYGVDMPLGDAERFRKRFFETYGGIAEWHRKIRSDTKREGRTLSGRKFAFGENAGLPERSNIPVQGTAADIIKKALGLLVNAIEGSDARIVAAVHDEIVLECDSSESEHMASVLTNSMEEAANTILPLVPTSVKAVISESWAEK